MNDSVIDFYLLHLAKIFRSLTNEGIISFQKGRYKYRMKVSEKTTYLSIR